MTMRWHHENRKTLYAALRHRIGPYQEWTAAEPELFRDLTDSYAIVVGAKSGEAVRLQVSYATSEKPQLEQGGIARNYILNKVAAFEAGFISAKLAFDSFKSSTKPSARFSTEPNFPDAKTMVARLEEPAYGLSGNGLLSVGKMLISKAGSDSIEMSAADCLFKAYKYYTAAAAFDTLWDDQIPEMFRAPAKMIFDTLVEQDVDNFNPHGMYRSSLALKLCGGDEPKVEEHHFDRGIEHFKHCGLIEFHDRRTLKAVTSVYAAT